MERRILLVWVAVLALLVPAERANAAELLFGCETDAEVSAWMLRSGGQDRLARDPGYATQGEFSMRFATPAWKDGMAQWPAFEVEPPVSDWRGYDRLMIDITHPGDGEHTLSLFVSDRKVPFREGLRYRFDLPKRGYRRFIVPLNFPEKVNRGDIGILHFFTQRPPSEMVLYIDNITLLRPGEQPPEPRVGFAAQVAKLFLDSLGGLDAALEQSRASLLRIADTPALRQRAREEMDALAACARRAREEASSPTLTLARLETIRHELEGLPGEARRVESIFRFRKAFEGLRLGDTPLLVGFATSMEKLLPRRIPFELSVARRVELALARNERESLQVAVMPRDGALKGVRVSVTDLKSRSGAVLPAARINCDVVGYVETKARPPYEVSHVGWWPDPILDFLGPVDVASGDLQSFWVRVHATKDQAPGLYEGTLQVAAEGVEPLSFPLAVRVYNFTLPVHTPLPTAITFNELKSQMGGAERWAEMKHRWADFLADYYIDYDNLYRQGPPDWEIAKRLHDEGRLVAFNLGNVFNAGTKEDGFDEAIAATIARLRPAYEKAKELGVLDHAYIYGFDERPKEQFPLLERSARALRQAFPEVLLMTTSYDHSYGLDSEVKTIDAWCPLTPRFDPERVKRARAAGKKVWWYICCNPHRPYANWFVESDAIEARLLMGAMTAKYRPDGFLYYALAKWNNNKPIETGPFTEWNPVSYVTYHGDGSILCSGPGGKPVPTIRLENYRDGMEDFAYACILEECIRRYEAKGERLTAREREWLAKAREALPVPETLVNTVAEYSRDPKAVYAWRNRVGEMIDRSGVPDPNPWGKAFGVRGFGG